MLGLPIALAKTANARAVLEAGMVYLTFKNVLGNKWYLIPNWCNWMGLE